MFPISKVLAGFCVTFGLIILGIVIWASKPGHSVTAGTFSSSAMPAAINSQVAGITAKATRVIPQDALAQATATTMSLVALATRAGAEPTGIVGSHNYGSWSYQAVRKTDGEVEARINVNLSSVSSLKAYAAANRALATQLATSGKDVVVKVTFKQPLPIDTYRAWAASSGIIHFDNVYVEAKNAEGQPSVFAIFPDSGDPYPSSILEEFLKNTKNKPSGLLTPEAIPYVEGKIPAKLLPAIANNSEVFLADVTQNIIQSELETNGVVAGYLAVVPPVHIYTSMQDLGLGNFR